MSTATNNSYPSQAGIPQHGARQQVQQAGHWESRLTGYINQKPGFEIISDRRGGRTAWSASISIEGVRYNARYWYDGNNIQNAKEDVAEVVVKQLQSNPIGQIVKPIMNTGYNHLDFNMSSHQPMRAADAQHVQHTGYSGYTNY